MILIIMLTTLMSSNDLIETNPLILSNNWFGCDNNYSSENFVPTKNSGEFAFKVEEFVQNVHYEPMQFITYHEKSSHQWFQVTKHFYSGFVQHQCMNPSHYFILNEFYFLPFFIQCYLTMV